MSVYNDAEYLSVAIESILQQTFENFELLIIDDASTDSSSDIIKYYAGQDGRIKHLTNQTNKGLPWSLNRGIEQATGRYIARMDADDISLSRRFEKQVEYLDSWPSAHVVGSFIRLIGMNGESLGGKSYPQGGRSPEQLKKQGPLVAHPSVMIRKSSLKQVNGYREPFTYAQDLDLWIRMSREFGEDFLHIIPEPLLEYRLSPNQYTRKSVIDVYRSYVGEYIECEDCLEEEIEKELDSRSQEISSSKTKMRFHYKAGCLSLDQGKRLQASKHFKQLLFHTPFSLHGWYGIGLVFLPKPLRKYIRSRV